MCSSNRLEDTTTLEVALPMERVWSFLGCLQQIENLAHFPSHSLGSYYPITVELTSPKLCAYKSKPGPRLSAAPMPMYYYYYNFLAKPLIG